MKCLHPILVKRADMYNPLHGTMYVEAPCGHCPACMKRRQQDWAIRIQHESDHTLRNGGSVWFTTLTYDDSHLPLHFDQDTGECLPELRKEDVQKFTRSVRDHIDYRYGTSFRFYCCGEYGDHFDRPHYHIVCFFESAVDFDTASLIFQKFWKNGLVLKVCPLTVKLSEYVAKYCTKRFGIDYGDLQPPFALMSTKPALGSSWVESNKDYYMYHKQMVVYSSSGIPHTLPRYYKDKMFSKRDVELYCERIRESVMMKYEAQCAFYGFDPTRMEREANLRYEEIFYRKLKTLKDGYTVL